MAVEVARVCDGRTDGRIETGNRLQIVVCSQTTEFSTLLQFVLLSRFNEVVFINILLGFSTRLRFSRKFSA
jgi:hypothetical protein